MLYNFTKERVFRGLGVHLASTTKMLPPSTPSTPPRRRQLTRDERLQAQTLRRAGHSIQFIMDFLKATRRQVDYALTSNNVTPQHRPGRPPILTDAQVDELEDFVRQSRAGRQMSYKALAEGPFEHWQVSSDTIRNALRSRGYRRCVARAKPPLTERNRQVQFEWAQAHVDWEPWQWWQILWSDETWVTGGRHRKVWITRRPGEELDPTCLVDKIRKKRGWMFWGCFSGTTKGPSVFWEKEWKTINKESYCDRIIPLVHGWLRLNPTLKFMQDGAPGHSASYTQDELHDRGIWPIFWPAFSPDLNPIEAVWNKMKDYIEVQYPDLDDGKQYTYDRLRVIVQEAWDRISEEYLQWLIDSMPERCQAVIDAKGGHTKY